MEMPATPAWDAWSSLPERTRSVVSELALRGLRHPDPEVAAVAGAWAEVVLSSATVSDRDWWWEAAGAAVAQLLSHPDPQWLVEASARRAERDWAARVLAANAGTAWVSPVWSEPKPRAHPQPRWTDAERRAQVGVLLPVMLGLVGVLVFIAVLASRP